MAEPPPEAMAQVSKSVQLPTDEVRSQDPAANTGRNSRRSSGEFNPSPGIRRSCQAAVRLSEKLAKAQAKHRKARKTTAALKLTLDTAQKEQEAENKAVDEQLDKMAATSEESATAC